MSECRARFGLYLFHRELDFDRACLEAGVDKLIVDLETLGKADRQFGFDTEINAHTIDDIHAIKRELGAYVMCRINAPGHATRHELDQVLSAGADEIIVPMIRDIAGVEQIVQHVQRECKITLMIETLEAVNRVAQLCAMPVHRLYVGLNDLSISRRSTSIFVPIMDGLLDEIRSEAEGVCFGFGGLTLPNRGHPLPVRHLMNEMARLNCSFSFLRRSFYRDVAGLAPETEIRKLREELVRVQSRSPDEVASDKARVDALVAQLATP